MQALLSIPQIIDQLLNHRCDIPLDKLKILTNGHLPLLEPAHFLAQLGQDTPQIHALLLTLIHELIYVRALAARAEDPITVRAFEMIAVFLTTLGAILRLWLHRSSGIAPTI
jgi:hypothetical protein